MESKSSTEGLSAVALYDYQATEEGELSFDPDDVITNIEKVSLFFYHLHLILGALQLILYFCVSSHCNYLFFLFFKMDEGWWFGTCHGMKGMFPSNYVEIIPTRPRR